MLNCGVQVYNLCINQGTTYQLSMTWELNACCGCNTAGAAPSPVDLTGYAVNMQIRAFPLSPTILYDASGDFVLGGTAGTIVLTIPATDTSSFNWWSAVYDIVLTSPTGVVTRILQGSVMVSPAVTVPPPGQPITTDSGIIITTDAGVQINTST
jgi:hypothetical protein